MLMHPLIKLVLANAIITITATRLLPVVTLRAVETENSSRRVVPFFAAPSGY